MGYPKRPQQITTVYNQAVADNEPWIKQPGESSKAYAAFIIYRNLAAKNRSLRRACEEHYGAYTGSGLRQLQEWSSRFMWVDRAGAWDAYVDREALDKQIEAVRQMAERHIKMAQGLVAIGLKRLSKMDPFELSPSDVLRYLQAAVTIERLTLGEPTEIQKIDKPATSSEVILAELSDDELRQRIIAMRTSSE